LHSTNTAVNILKLNSEQAAKIVRYRGPPEKMSFDHFLEFLETTVEISADFNLVDELGNNFVEVLNLLKEVPETTSWETYIVRKSDWSKIYQNSNQKIYGNLMHKGVVWSGLEWSLEVL
jgi:hypothetical protein